jgi:arylsulfatase A-like enzyme
MRKRAWRTPEWKLIEALEPDIYGKPPVELYHLGSDPGETHNLANERPEVAAELAGQLRAWVERRLRETGHPDPLVEQADALRIWQPRFIAGRAGR